MPQLEVCVCHEECSGLTEDKLVDRARSGDRGAFAELIARNYQTCLRMAYSVLRNQSDAEDEVQNTCLKALEHLDQFRGDAKFSTWMVRILMNQCLMRFRAARRSREESADSQREDGVRKRSQVAEAGPTPEQAMVQTQFRELLHKEIGRVPAPYRHALVRTHLHGTPLPAIAAELGISLPAAKSRLVRGRMALRRRLFDHCGTLGYSYEA
jgi:RNA polymerase sigma-70 factor (ECF subfamily)